MAKIELRGTEFSFTLLPLKLFHGDFWAKTEIVISNDVISYKQIENRITADEVEDWIFCMFRLLAGAYKTDYTITFEKKGFSVDFYSHTKNGQEVSREERRKEDCIMAIRMLMRGKNGEYLDGVYTLLLHRKDIEKFANDLREEFDKIFHKRARGVGNFLFVGVSPLGYKGCNYWYIDIEKEVKAGDYVWVEMGRHKKKQIVYVDSVRYFTEQSAPYSVERVKRVICKATKEELQELGLVEFDK